jgi:hypothetical protein
MGIARADGDLVSAAKATLDALNRYVTMDPERQRELEEGDEPPEIAEESHPQYDYE